MTKILTKSVHFSLLLGGVLLFSTYIGMATGASTVYASTGNAQAANIPVSTNLSENWSGYESTEQGNYTSVTGTWIVPTVNSNSSLAADATWVGIGGVSTNDLIQAGTEALIENGSIEYQAWYEMLPGVSTPVSLTVNPGNSITTTLTETSPNTWEINITNNSTEQSFVTSVNYSSTLSSAEWVEEMLSDQNGLIPLDSFGSVEFTNAQTVHNGISENLISSGATPLSLVSSNGSVLAYPSSLGSDAESFTVTEGNETIFEYPTDVTTTEYYVPTTQFIVVNPVRIHNRHGFIHLQTSLLIPGASLHSYLQLRRWE